MHGQSKEEALQGAYVAAGVKHLLDLIFVGLTVHFEKLVKTFIEAKI